MEAIETRNKKLLQACARCQAYYAAVSGVSLLYRCKANLEVLMSMGWS